VKAREPAVEWLRSYYAALDAGRFDEVAEFLHADCRNQYPDGLVVVGRERIMRGMRSALGALAGISHELRRVWEEDEEVIFELEVTYRRRDGGKLVRPGAGVMVRRDGLIVAQRMFVDAAGVWD
jgi:ketosteroid isomerase-like protein